MTYVAAAKVSKRCCAAAIAALASLTACRAGVDFVLRGGGVVARGLHVDDRLVDAFLLGLDGGAEVLQLLVGVGDGGDQRAEAVRVARVRRRPGRVSRAARRDQQKRDRRDRWRCAEGAEVRLIGLRSPMAQRERGWRTSPDQSQKSANLQHQASYCTVRHI